MARPAPSIDRVAAVLDYLADHPGTGFTLSELARRLELNKATCHAMFAGLEEYGFLRRHPVEKTYTLGPALIRLAAAVAADESEALRYAHAVMAELTEELSLASLASTLIADEMVVLAVYLPAGPYAPPTGRIPAIGQRSSWVPPIGSVQAAWAPPEARAEWVKRANPALGDDYNEEFLAVVRKRGYDMGIMSDPRHRILKAFASFNGPADSETVQKLLVSILDDAEQTLSHPVHDPGPTENLGSLTAPVFGRDGQVLLSLTINGFENPVTSSQLERYVKRLLQATSTVTRALHGRYPDDYPKM